MVGRSRRGTVTTFLALVAVMVVLAAGQLFVLAGLDSTVLGIPLWIWVHLAILAVLVALAWIATSVVSGRGDR